MLSLGSDPVDEKELAQFFAFMNMSDSDEELSMKKELSIDELVKTFLPGTTLVVPTLPTLVEQSS